MQIYSKLSTIYIRAFDLCSTGQILHHKVGLKKVKCLELWEQYWRVGRPSWCRNNSVDISLHIFFFHKKAAVMGKSKSWF